MRLGERGPGAAGFTRQYWDENYAKPEIMDGVYNARRKALALRALLDAEYYEVESLADFGFGLGYIFQQMIDVFLPQRVLGLEPSPYIFQLALQQPLTEVKSIDIQLVNLDLLTWCQTAHDSDRAPFDLGVCTSVFQYLSDWEIEQVLPVLARRVKYLYLNVPTDREFQYQAEELDFVDRYAISRSQADYLRMFQGHFTIVSNSVLESNVHFDVNSTYFSDLLFRF